MRQIFRDYFPFCARSPVISAALGFLCILVVIALTSHSFLTYFNLEGLLIVVGGVVAVAFMSFDSKDVNLAIDAITTMFKEPKMTQENLHRDITAIIYCARLLREKGMRNLESVISKSGISDPFIKYGLNMVVSDYEPEEVRAMLETAAEACYERDSVPVDVLTSMAGHAPAFGMVGTLVGMVTMMVTLNGDMSAIGPALAVAFISTLYGVLLARLIFIPASSKLRQKVANRRFRNYLITEGLVLLLGNKGPMFIQDRLNSFLRLDGQDYVNVITSNKPAMPLHHIARAA